MPTNNEEFYEYMKKPLKPANTYVDMVYDIVKLDCESMDAIYKDYIIQMVGVYGFNALHENKLIESCGVMNGRYLYVLCPKPDTERDKNYEELLEENKKLKDIILKGEV